MLGISPDLAPPSGVRPLERETNDLDALSAGLRHHLAAWRTRHEQVTGHARKIVERIDLLLDKARALTPPAS